MKAITKNQTQKIINLLQEKKEIQEQLIQINKTAHFVYSSEKESNFRFYIPGKKPKKDEFEKIITMMDSVRFPIGRPQGLFRVPEEIDSTNSANDLDLSISDRECLTLLGILIGCRESRLREIGIELGKLGLKIKE